MTDTVWIIIIIIYTGMTGSEWLIIIIKGREKRPLLSRNYFRCVDYVPYYSRSGLLVTGWWSSRGQYISLPSTTCSPISIDMLQFPSLELQLRTNNKINFLFIPCPHTCLHRQGDTGIRGGKNPKKSHFAWVVTLGFWVLGFWVFGFLGFW